MQIQTLEILVVEASDALRAAMVAQLEALGATRITAAAGTADALQRMRGQRFDVVLSGWNTKLMDGLALLKAVRADERLRHVGMVMVTADAGPDEVEEAIASGVSELLVKPYTGTLLQSKLVQSVGRREPAAPPAPRPAGTRHSLLVVDDTPENLQLVAQLFADEYEVRAVRSGERALQICTGDSPPDLVLLDVMMPGMDGFEVARRMREHPTSETIPVVFVTALHETRHEKRGLDLGAVDYVTKPIDPDLLRLRVRNFMRWVDRHKQRQAELDAQIAAARAREGVEELLRHDLRSPIAGVLGAAHLLDQVPGLPVSARRLARLVTVAGTQALDTMNLSGAMLRIEAGTFSYEAEPVDLEELVRQAVDLAGVWRESKSLAFDLATEPAWALADRALCTSVLNNLLRNACEAAPAGSTVRLQVTAGAEVAVTIRNQGAVAQDVRERFFERYVTGGKRGGSGLGTYSARLLTEAQGGHIAMRTSDADDSTELTVSLPCAPVPQLAGADATQGHG